MIRATGIDAIWKADQRDGRTPLAPTRVHAPMSRDNSTRPVAHLISYYLTTYSSTPAPVRRLLPFAEQREQPAWDFI
ncbi:hypothetical protein CTAM01_16739 [Colletotrichum tamarilloi]|uniref:Uncharacterized protein n=1 Tax=Colletotrichum tamarilloi TaxID=1209934 RepID=A0ABQ9QHN0_9PEZI|nr:uncharacterized protein CTAM01_16739 [Colletotrichum tamarilloi]KAK1470631.1 hypothetical protein CTAM01_16739 [Colletotrichum tamarilloi]